MKLYRYVSIGLMLLVALLLLISCDNSVSVKAENYEVSIIEPDYSLNPDNGIGEKNVSISIEGVDFMIKMNPLWRNNDGSSIYGDTGDNYIAINDVNSIGYFAQGLWNYSVKAYYNKNEIYTYSGQVEINKYSRTITIDPSSLVVSDNNSSSSTVKLSSFDILLVDSFDKYNQEVEGGFKYTVGVKSLENGNIIIDENLISKEYLSSSDGVVASIASSGFEVGSVSNGAYEISVLMYEWIWSVEQNKWQWEKTGGTSSSFVGIPGAPLTISGIEGKIDLYPSDYVDVGMGESGIIIDSGVKTEVTVKAYDSSNKEITTTTAGQTISVKAVVKEIIDKNTSNTIRVDNYKWFVDGAEVTDKVNSSVGITLTKPVINLSDGSLLFYSTSAKTYTITYMFLDGTNYNTISGNCYLTVNAATTSTP